MAARGRRVLAGAGLATASEAVLVHLGRTYGSTPRERALSLPGDGIVEQPTVVTNHAITIGVPPAHVWPWLLQMGWGRGGWYTARWVDWLLFPANGPSANELLPYRRALAVGDVVPDGPPAAKCCFIVEQVVPERTLVLHSRSHLPLSWRLHHTASLDWSWTVHLMPIDGGRRTRYLLRSRWATAPWWLTIAGHLLVVPADFVMARDHLRGVKHRAERLFRRSSQVRRARAASPVRPARRGDGRTPGERPSLQLRHGAADGNGVLTPP